MRRAADIEIAVQGGDHPEVATTLSNLARIHLDAGELDEALSIYQEALEILRGVYGSEHPRVATALDNVAAAYAYLEDMPQAHAYKARADEIRAALAEADAASPSRDSDPSAGARG